MTVLPSVRLLGQAHGHRRRPWNFGTRQQVAIAEWRIVGYDMRVSVWRADRVAEGACLLSEYSPKDYLGFESPALRQTMSAPARKIAGRRFAFYLSRPPLTRTHTLARIAPHALGRALDSYLAHGPGHPGAHPFRTSLAGWLPTSPRAWVLDVIDWPLCQPSRSSLTDGRG